MQCNSCEVVYINGRRCHEPGCPDAWKDYPRECKECGTSFTSKDRHQDCCSHTCHVAYHGLPCGCEECVA